MIRQAFNTQKDFNRSSPIDINHSIELKRQQIFIWFWCFSLFFWRFLQFSAYFGWFWLCFDLFRLAFCLFQPVSAYFVRSLYFLAGSAYFSADFQLILAFFLPSNHRFSPTQSEMVIKSELIPTTSVLKVDSYSGQSNLDMCRGWKAGLGLS